ncbi:MAG: membrane protein [bacterium]|nr:MAG: membrane protein [bacterium]
MKKLILGVYDNEKILMKAIKSIRDNKIKLRDVFTPYPVHGLDDVMGIKPSRLPVVAFVMGAIGAASALYFQYWTVGVSWKLNIGGKPPFALPSFIIITFETMILLAALSMVGAFLLRSKLFPTFNTDMIHPRATNDQFIIAIDPQNNDVEEDKIKTMLKENGASDVQDKEVTK